MKMVNNTTKSYWKEKRSLNRMVIRSNPYLQKVIENALKSFHESKTHKTS